MSPSETARVGVPSIRSIIPTLVIDGLLPYLAYHIGTAFGLSEIAALGAGAVFPALHGFLSIWHRRSVDIIAAIVLVGIAVSVTALLVGGSPRLFLIRESSVTGALGLLALSSFAWRRPLLFYIGRQFSAGQDRAAAARFDDLWQREGARRTFRVMTLVWAIGWLSEFAVRVLMVLTLSVATVLAVSPVIFNGITVGLIVWTIDYARRQRARGQSGQYSSTTSP